MERKNIETIVLTDFSKAFDLVNNYSDLIQKPFASGGQRTIVPRILTFLYDRKQCGDLNNFLDWSVTNELIKLNPTKFQALQVCFMWGPPPLPDLETDQSLLSFISYANVLVIWLQNDLKWDIIV